MWASSVNFDLTYAARSHVHSVFVFCCVPVLAVPTCRAADIDWTKAQLERGATQWAPLSHHSRLGNLQNVNGQGVACTNVWLLLALSRAFLSAS